MRKNEKKSIFSLGPNGPILQIFLVVQYLVGSLKIPSDGSNNLIFLDRVKKSCEGFRKYRQQMALNIAGVSELALIRVRR